MTDHALLADHVDLLTGFPFKSAHYSQEGDDVRLVRGDNIVQGALRWDNAARWPRRQISDVEQYELKAGDVVLAMDRPWIEAGLKYARMRDLDVPSLLVQRVARLRVRAELDQGFLFYLIGSRAFSDHVLAVQTGTTVPHISGKQILSFEFALPPMDQQRAIAAVLGALDDKIEQNRRTGRALEKLARATFKAWFVDFEPVKAKAAGATDFPGMPHAAFAALSDRLTDTPLGAVPGGWRISSIGAELETFLGGTPSRARSEFWTDGTVPWINSGEVNKFPIINPTSLITPAALASSSTKLIPARSTVIAITGATLGQVSILGIAACTNQSVVSIIGSKALPTEFIYPWVKENIDRLLATSTGAAQQHVNKKDVNALPVLCPDARLMDGYVSIVGPVFDSVLHLSAESRKLAALRDYLLPRLLSGRVRVLQAETEVKA